MSFWKDWLKFLKENAKKNMKRFSIAIGSFLVLVISSLGFQIDTYVAMVYAGFVETATIIIMSLFGKNGNGATHNQLNSTEPEPESSSETETLINSDLETVIPKEIPL